MRKRIGTKLYDTDKAVLVDTLPDGIQVYKKKNSPQFFLYNPSGENKHEMFFELPADQAEKYLPNPDTESKITSNVSKAVKFSDYNIARMKRLAGGMPVAQFILSLVDEYERNHQ